MDISSSPSALVVHKGAKRSENPCVDSSILSLGTSEPLRPCIDKSGPEFARFVERFWSHVDKENGPVHPILGRCWDWTLGLGTYGYGSTSGAAWFNGGKDQCSAHRVSFFLDRGAFPPPGMLVRHKCNRRRCVRPDHLDSGTSADNAQDAVEAGSYPRGEAHRAAKLTEAEVVAMRTQRAAGARGVDLAAAFGVTAGLVSQICIGKAWPAFGGPIVAPMRRGRIRRLPIDRREAARAKREAKLATQSLAVSQ